MWAVGKYEGFPPFWIVMAKEERSSMGVLGDPVLTKRKFFFSIS
jgi:hypothetical protein